MKVVITGATGIIGRSLIEYLLEKNMKYMDVLDKYNNIFKMYDNVILGCTHLLKIPKEEYSVNSIDQIEEIKKVVE